MTAKDYICRNVAAKPSRALYKTRRVIDAKQFKAVARPVCARILLPEALVTARHTATGELSCSAVATTPDTDRRDETG
jgi:hypothetical protein